MASMRQLGRVRIPGQAGGDGVGKQPAQEHVQQPHATPADFPTAAARVVGEPQAVVLDLEEFAVGRQPLGERTDGVRHARSEFALGRGR